MSTATTTNAEANNNSEISTKIVLEENNNNMQSMDDNNEEEKNDDPKDTVAAAAAAAAKKNKKKEKEKAKKEKEKDEKKDAGAAKKKTKATTSDLIKEAMKLRLEEEEKARKKQEEEEKRLQELEEQRLQKIKEEQERKERKKQKEKERIERLKKEGKYLNAEQKQKLARQREMVEQLKQQGLIIGPNAANEGEAAKKPTKMAGRLRKNKQAEKEDSKETSPDLEKKEIEATVVDEENKASDEEDDILESWDMIELDDEENDVTKSAINKDSEENLAKEKLVAAQTEQNNAASPAAAKDDDSKTKVPAESSTTVLPLNEKIDKISLNNNNSDDTLAANNNNSSNRSIREKESVPDRIKRRTEERFNTKTENVLRSPVVCVLGHVDTGKTKILDKIRQTHVQDGEAGGITQQIGATFVPGQAIKDQGKMVNNFDPRKLNLPGFLIIDTPGHESFSNLRLRGSSLCDIAILVIDIMHGLEPQTIESLNMLKKRKTPFVIALNKIDRLYEWKPQPQMDVENVLKTQKGNAKREFKDRFNEVQAQFSEQGMNMALYWEMEKKADKTDYIAVIPTSAHSGDGMGNLMCALAQICQNQYKDRLTYRENLECSVLEVKSLPGLGTTIDVILLNGRLRVGDTIVVAGMEGPIVTQIRELLMPQPMRELRVKNPYEHYKELKGAQGIKILAKDLDKALAGIPLMVAENEDEIDYFKDEVAKLLEHTLHSIKLCDKGVYVQASTLGSLEALLDFLRSQKIPYSGINIGPVHRKDVMKASAMLEHDIQWAVILAFDVKIEQDAELEANKVGVKIFQADIIYHLQDAFVKYREELKQKKRQENAHLAIFPCKLRVLPQHVFKTRDPIVVGVSIDDGILKIGTPLCVPSKECIFLGTVSSIEINQKPIESARKGQEVAIKIENTTGDAPKMYGRHFDYQDLLVSRITRETIEACKQFFREDLQKTDWQLIVELKKTLNIL